MSDTKGNPIHAKTIGNIKKQSKDKKQLKIEIRVKTLIIHNFMNKGTTSSSLKNNRQNTVKRRPHTISLFVFHLKCSCLRKASIIYFHKVSCNESP